MKEREENLSKSETNSMLTVNAYILASAVPVLNSPYLMHYWLISRQNF